MEVLDSLLTMKKYNVNDIFDDKSAVSYYTMNSYV